MTDTPPPRPAGNRKTLGFMIGALVLVAAAYFADGGSAGQGMAPPAASTQPAPVANPAEPAAPATTTVPVN
jgi:hypothetical protein